METLSISEILKSNYTPDIFRFSYLPYQMSVAKEIFKKIGQKRGKEFIIDSENVIVIENLIKWAQGDETFQALNPETLSYKKGDLTKGIYIAGATGTGKSLLLEILAEYLLIDNVKAIFFGKNIKQLSYPYYTANKICKYYSDSGDLFPFTESTILCIQDIGSEQKETLYMGTRTKVIQTILQERGDTRGLITLITSNNAINDTDTLDLYGDRIVSRLQMMCNYFELTGKDRRK